MKPALVDPLTEADMESDYIAIAGDHWKVRVHFCKTSTSSFEAQMFLVEVSDIFIFSARWRGKRESEAPGGGGIGFLSKMSRGGGVSRWGRGREGVCGKLGNWGGGGGAKYFLSGPKRPPSVRWPRAVACFTEQFVRGLVFSAYLA